MRETVEKVVLFAATVIMLTVLAPAAGLAAGVVVSALFDLNGPSASVAVVVSMITTTALGCWAGLVLERGTTPHAEDRE